MSVWSANPKDSWIGSSKTVFSGKKECCVGNEQASYAINQQFSSSLNGEVSGIFSIPDWQNLGAAGLICRADSLWSFVALYIYAPNPGAGEIVPVLVSYRSGEMIPLAIGKEKIKLERGTVQLNLVYDSGNLSGVAISGENKSTVKIVAAHNPFPGYVGLIRFNQADVRVKKFEFQPILKQHKSMPKQINYKWDVFISHSSKDKIKVREIVSKLKSEGLKVWFDEEQIDIVDNVLEQIEEGLKYSNYIIACLSPSYGQSSWCQGEYRPIMNAEISRTDRKRIITLVIEKDVKLDDIPISLRDKFRLQYNSANDWQKLVDKLHSS